MRGFSTRTAALIPRSTRGLVIACAPEAAEDLAADGVVPVAEGVANRARAGGPRAPTEHLVLGSEEDFGVFPIGKALEAGPGHEIARGPLPHVADHAPAAQRRQVPRVGADGGGTEGELIDVGEGVVGPLVAPGVGPLGGGRSIPPSRGL